MKNNQPLFILLLLFINGVLTGQSINYLELPKDRQFDFWVGTWDVNLRVKQPDQSWADQIKSVAKIYSVSDGRAILELWNDQRPLGIKGFSLRYYDFQKEKWVLWLNWPSYNRSGMSTLEGEFRHGRGEFFSGKGDTLTRYSFSDITPHSLRWDDAFTFDGGKTWTHNWIMEFKRTEQEPAMPDGEEGHTYDQGGRCTLPGFDVFRDLVGNWKGEVKTKNGTEWQAGSASMKGFEVLQGCAVLNFLEYEQAGKKVEEFSIKSFNTYVNMLEDGRIGSGKQDVLKQFFGQYDEGSKQFELIESGQQEGKSIKYAWDFSENGKVKIEVSRGYKTGLLGWVKFKEINLTKEDQ